MVTTVETFQKPRWLRDLIRFLPLKSQFVLTGSVRDLQARALGHAVTSDTLDAVLAAALVEAGYSDIVVYDVVGGFRVLDRPGAITGTADQILGRLGLTVANGRAPAGLDLFSTTMERFVQCDGAPLALLVDFASRLVQRSDALSAQEHQLFTRALVSSQVAQPRPVGPGHAPLFNSIIWVADKEGDLPDWFVINNARLRHIPVSVPDRSVRRAIAPYLIRSFPRAREAPEGVLLSAEDELVDETEGLHLVDLNAIAQLARSEDVGVGEVSEAIRRYKVGVTEDSWKKIERNKIASGEATIAKRVKGQTHAVTHMLDIVKRAATGIGGGRRSGRPRGVAFLAGPTGVGKTELAKATTELLFGDETAYIRFDMSEFSAEHADQRLIGAPPGYVGYDVGGELTNAIRERPFSVVLFDEIEKAHPRILDKFLQILDDGVLTSGRGDRVYFSEALIVFTSNLGIYSSDANGARVANVTPANTFAEVRDRVRSEIDKHFKLVLNRPEILNRIGENVIVFDFIRPEVADAIFETMVSSVIADASSLGYDLAIADEAKSDLKRLCVSDLSNGGRGIRNQIEAHLINPLARGLFPLGTAGRFNITGLEARDMTTLAIERL